MKKRIFTLVICLVAFVQTQGQSQELPSIDLNTLDYGTANTEEFTNDGNPIVISFWAMWCSPCKRELNAIAEMYPDWQAETGVKLIAVSIDDSRNIDKVKPYVDGQAWDYEVYLDPNSDFKRAMNVNTIPHTFLLNGDKEIVWQHNSYTPGDEHELYDLVKKLANGESIN